MRKLQGVRTHAANWWARHHRVVFIVIGLVVSEIILQLLYPHETTMPFARVVDRNVGRMSRNDLTAEFQTRFESSVVEITSGDRTSTGSLSKLGATLDADTMVTKLTTYPLWQRLLPFSLVALQPRVTTLDVSFDESVKSTATAQAAKNLSYEPTNAALSLETGELKVVAAKSGRSVTEADVARALANTRFSAGKTVVNVTAKELKPQTADADIAEAKAAAEGSLARELVLRVTDKGDFKPDKAERAKWLSLPLKDNAPTVVANIDAIKAYVASLAGKLDVKPGVSTVTVVDNVEQSRTSAASGLALNQDDVAGRFATALLDRKTSATIKATMDVVAPSTTYNRSYSNTEAGLRAYVAYATSTQNVRIVVQQLDGAGWSALGRASESIPSASTYKLYVMMRVFDDINSGKLSWDTPMLDTNAGGCFERTIIVSTNPCAEEWIRQFGRDNLNNYVHQKGFSEGTGFTFSDATHTTAGDLAKYLIGLNNGSLITGANRDMLLEKMSRQNYRYGIPTGSKGWVQDKVGYLWDYIHDAGIVHHPKGTYVLVVMTKGYSYGYIANVTRQIESIMYP